MIQTYFTRSEKITVGALALTTFFIHIIVNVQGGYGLFRDELYYIACTNHLDWGYVDQPPFSIYLLKLSRLILGDSLVAIRFIPALLHGLLIVITALIVKEIKGNHFAVFIACIAMMVSVIHQAMGEYYSMNIIDIFIWALTFYLLVKIINTRKNSLWIWLGIILGIGLLNKISVLFLGAGIFAGLLLTDRTWFTTRWPYMAGTIAFTLFLPYIIWNINHDMAHLEFIHNASAGKYADRTALDFIKEQLLLINPINIPFWLCGLGVLLFYKPLHSYRILAWVYITAFLILVFNKTSKGEYLAPAYVTLMAGAGVFLEQKLTTSYSRWVRYVYPALMIISLIALLPMVMPVLSEEHYISYSESLGVKPSSSENKELSELPQFYADMHGWQSKARDVAAVYNTLSEEDKAKCAIYSNNYGRCGAIDFYGEQYGLPKSIGSHNNYYLWGSRNYKGEVMIILGGTMDDHRDDFESCQKVATSSCKYCMPYENNLSIFLCRGLKFNLKEAWPSLKHYE